MSAPKLGTSMDIERTILEIEWLERLSSGSACLSAGQTGEDSSRIDSIITSARVDQDSTLRRRRLRDTGR